MHDTEIGEITITLMLTGAQARILATALEQLAPAIRTLAGHDADEAMVLIVLDIRHSTGAEGGRP